ncbi:hypothetical protein BRI6_4058 [plant metagenome]|uniref:DUF2946 domain-containing protein n=1 Tax=plant metagenome TaxID=1297885 RepID=A0A484XJ66_9ZZZZ
MPVRRHLARRVFSVWHLLVCLTALALVARALLPVGFMPDTQALRHGTLALTLCSSEPGASRVLSLSPGHGAGQEAASMLDCPFGLVAVQALLPAAPPAGVAAALPRAAPAAVQAMRSLPPLPAQGPPLGSRAPPVTLA